MIQPINALCPRAVFRGQNRTYGERPQGITNSKIALLSAGGLAAAAGGLTTIVARAHTNSWPQAAILGTCGAFLSMFFMTPQLIERSGVGLFAKKGESITATETQKVADAVKSSLKPSKKLIHFRQQA